VLGLQNPLEAAPLFWTVRGGIRGLSTKASLIFYIWVSVPRITKALPVIAGRRGIERSRGQPLPPVVERDEERIMKRIQVMVASIVLATVAATSQTASKLETKPAGLGKAPAISNEELNVRAYIQLLRTNVRKEASQVLGEVMQLDSDQAAKFWPVYKEFEAEYSVIGDQIVALVRNYANHHASMTGAIADQLASQVLTIENQRNDLKKKYYGRIKSALDPIIAMRFLQVFNQLERLMDLQTAAQLPVIGTE
jgi:hypothetical protein